MTSPIRKIQKVKRLNDCLLYLNPGIITHDQLNEVISRIVPKCKYHLPEELHAVEWRTAVVNPTEAYVWFNHPAYAYLLRGLDSNGHEMFTLVPDSNWQINAEKEQELTKKIAELHKRIAHTNNWGEMEDLEDEAKELEKQLERPLIKEPVAPLIGIPSIKYTKAQLSQLQKKHPGQMVPTSLRPKFTDAYAYAPIGDLQENTLTCKVPTELASLAHGKLVGSLWHNFRLFATTDRVKVVRRGDKVDERPYPYVHIRGSKAGISYAIIEFDPLSEDGSFAKLVAGRVTIRTGKDSAVEMAFNHGRLSPAGTSSV